MWRAVGGATIMALASALAVSGCADDGPVDPRAGPAERIDIYPISSGQVTTDPLAATVAIRVTACRPVVERGVGVMVSPGRVLTAAHVVAGATSIRVLVPGELAVDAAVVAFDPVEDLAVLEVPVGTVPHLVLATDPPTGVFEAEVVLFRQDRAVVEHVEVLRRVKINTDDIYRGDPVSRPGYEIRAGILPGDSGAAVVRDGEVVAVVWSRSRITDGRAWAIDPIRGGAEIRRQLASRRIPDAIDLDRCS